MQRTACSELRAGGCCKKKFIAASGSPRKRCSGWSKRVTCAKSRPQGSRTFSGSIPPRRDKQKAFSTNGRTARTRRINSTHEIVVQMERPRASASVRAMSDFTVIRDACDTLKSILETGITNSPDPQLNGVPIDLRSPKEMREDNNASGISLWLYRVGRDADLLNRPPERISPNQFRRSSLPVRLYYLVTPLVAKPEDRQTLLGRVLQLLNDHTQLLGAG